MPIKTYRPTTQTLRYRTTLSSADLTTTSPHKPLLEAKQRSGGRRNSGDITLWHRGGANRRTAPRLALSTQYCEPWARQQENFTLAIAPEIAAGFSARVQELLGYSIHPPFMGHTGGLHPKRRLHP